MQNQSHRRRMKVIDMGKKHTVKTLMIDMKEGEIMATQIHIEIIIVMIITEVQRK